MKTNAVIGLDLGGTKLAGAIFDSDGKILHRMVAPLQGRKGREVGELIGTRLKQFLKIAHTKKIPVKAVGACVPGIANQKTGKVWAPNIPGWEDYPLRKEISALITGKKIKVTVDSDRACYILGEAWQGAAKGCENAIFVAVGTGIGAGILVNGEILRGAHDIAGAIGWLALERPHRPEYGPCGCFEHHASGNGIAKIARELLATEKSYTGVLRKKPDLTAHDIFKHFPSGDPIAVKTLNQAVEFWGMAVANLVSIFNPEKIIFGGGVFGPATQFLPDIYAEAWKWAQPISIKQVKLEASKLGTDAGLYGAGFLALRSLKGKKGS